MSADSNNQALARDGLRQIETAILRLLDANPRGLRNVDIARNLGLSFDFGGNYKNQVTYAVLGRLMERGDVARDPDTKFSSAEAGTIPLWIRPKPDCVRLKRPSLTCWTPSARAAQRRDCPTA